MIQTNELRRGNLVNHAARKDQKGNVFAGLIGPFRVDEIREKSLSVTHLPDGLPFGMSYKDAEGIPLTPELLEAMGFIKSNPFGAGGWYRRGYFGIYFFNEGEDWRLEIKNIEHEKTPRFVHELQNLIFALTGEEVEIKLIV